MFNVDDEDEDQSDVFFRFELQFRRNGFQQSGEGVFVDNLVVRLRVADTAVYDSPTAGALTTVDAASFVRVASLRGRSSRLSARVSRREPNCPFRLRQRHCRPISQTSRFALTEGLRRSSLSARQVTALSRSTTNCRSRRRRESRWSKFSRGNRLVASEYLAVSATAPGVFTFNSTGQGQAVALNQDFTFNGPLEAPWREARKPRAIHHRLREWARPAIERRRDE